MPANNLPGDCWLGWVPILGAPWAFSERCREAYDLRAAGLPDPPRTSAPVVPAGGYEGAVYDPRAVDEVIDRTASLDRSSFQRFFDSLPSREPERNGLVIVAAGLALLGLYVVLRKS